MFWDKSSKLQNFAKGNMIDNKCVEVMMGKLCRRKIKFFRKLYSFSSVKAVK
jgi:hypothetical protein